MPGYLIRALAFTDTALGEVPMFWAVNEDSETAALALIKTTRAQPLSEGGFQVAGTLTDSTMSALALMQRGDVRSL